MKRKNVALGCGGVGVLGALAGGLGLVVLLVVLLLVGVPFLLKGRIEHLVQEQIAQSVDADVSFGNVDVSLISSFPRLRVAVHDVKVVGRAPFEGVPLADISEVRVGVDLLAALTSQAITVRSVTLVDPKFQVVVNKQGKANYDIAKGGGSSGDSSGGGGSGMHLKLDDVALQHLEASYDDQKGKIHAIVSGLDMGIKADLAGNVSHVDANGTIAALSARMGRLSYLRNTKWNVAAKLDYDATTGGITLQENKTTVNEFPIVLTGSVVPAGADWNLDLAFNSKDATFASLLSLVPKAFKTDTQGVDSTGTLAFDGTAKGRFSSADQVWPGFDVTVGVRDAKFKYPDLPAVENIDVDLKATHEEGPQDTTEIDVSQFAFKVAGAPFEAKAKVQHPLTDPLVDATAKGHLDLASVSPVLPLPEGTEIPSGQMDLDVAFSGTQSDFMTPNPDKIKASGTVTGKDVTYKNPDMPVPLVMDALAMTIGADSAKIQTLNGHYGSNGDTSDVAITGKFDNLIGYVLGGETLAGTVAVTSKNLDLRPFQGSGTGKGDKAAKAGKNKAKAGGGPAEPAPADASDEGLLVAVPTNLALNVDADIGHARTKLVDADKIKGHMAVKDGTVAMKDVQASVLGGTAMMSGSYAAPTADSADVDLKVSTMKFDLGKTVATFSTFKRLVPILDGVAGRFDSGVSVKTRLARDGTPDLEMLNSDGSIGPSGVKLNAKSMGKVAGQLGGAAMSTLDLDGSKIAYSIMSGKAKLQPINLKLGTVPAKLSGSAGVLDKTLDLVFAVKLPTKGLDAALLGGGGGKGDKADVELRVKGTWDDPKFSVGLDGLSPADVVSGLVDGLTGGGDDGKDGKAGKAGKEGGDKDKAKVDSAPDAAANPDNKDAKAGKAGKAGKAKAQ